MDGFFTFFGEFIMTRVKWDQDYKKYFVLFADGSKGWISRRGMEELYPLYDWDIVKEKSNQWFYI